MDGYSKKLSYGGLTVSGPGSGYPCPQLAAEPVKSGAEINICSGLKIQARVLPCAVNREVYE